MQRSLSLRLSGCAVVCLTILVGVWALLRPVPVTQITIPDTEFYRFPGVSGPGHVSVVPPAVPAKWTGYSQGTTSRLAILLTDPDSAWLGLAHGLKSIGVPFLITHNVQEAIRHQTILVYPTISGKVLSPEALRALAAFPRSGGTLIGVQVRGGGLNEVFGFDEAVDSHQRVEIEFGQTDSLLASFTEPRERRLSVGRRDRAADSMGTVGYTKNAVPLALFEDGTAAVTSKAYARGRAYAIGLDLGFLLLKGHNNRGEELVRDFDNQFDPMLDVWLRLLTQIYRSAQDGAVTLGTVPFGKSLSVLLTHDIDFTQSIKNAVDYAEYEKSQGLVGTYFIQAKYVRDYNDDVYFNETGVGYLTRLAELGVELGSHTIAHSAVFSKFPMGTGEEAYPTYVPFVKDMTTAYNGSILGELRISKYLLEHFSGQTVLSFRPGHLSNPFGLPQALLATGYRYSSTATANNSLTHLPYQLNYDRSTSSEVEIFEFPVTIEDEELPKMGDRLPQALDVARQISRYGGLCVVLIHPNILDHKLAFEKGFVEGVRPYAWFGSIAQFGQWWAARNQVQLDVAQEAAFFRVTITAPQPLSGLTINVPDGWRIQQPASRLKGIEQRGTSVLFSELRGTETLLFQARSSPNVAQESLIIDRRLRSGGRDVRS